MPLQGATVARFLGELRLMQSQSATVARRWRGTSKGGILPRPHNILPKKINHV